MLLAKIAKALSFRDAKFSRYYAIHTTIVIDKKIVALKPLHLSACMQAFARKFVVAQPLRLCAFLT